MSRIAIKGVNFEKEFIEAICPVGKETTVDAELSDWHLMHLSVSITRT